MQMITTTRGPGGMLMIDPPPARPTPPAANLKARARFDRLVDQLAHPDVELMLETVAPLIATFEQLRRGGEVFDRALVVLIGKLRAQAFAREAEGGHQ